MMACVTAFGWLSGLMGQQVPTGDIFQCVEHEVIVATNGEGALEIVTRERADRKHPRERIQRLNASA